MSNFKKIETDIRSRNLLVQAIEDLGYKPQVSDAPTVIKDYYNKPTGSANVVIPRGQLKGQTYPSDFGFLMKADGRYDAVIDHLNRSDASLLAGIKTRYGVRHALLVAGQEGYEMSSLTTSKSKTGNRTRMVLETGGN